MVIFKGKKEKQKKWWQRLVDFRALTLAYRLIFLNTKHEILWPRWLRASGRRRQGYHPKESKEVNWVENTSCQPTSVLFYHLGIWLKNSPSPSLHLDCGHMTDLWPKECEKTWCMALLTWALNCCLPHAFLAAGTQWGLWPKSQPENAPWEEPGSVNYTEKELFHQPGPFIF